MAGITWDNSGEKVFETGVDHGVLYKPDASGAYINGVAWNGLTTVTESPSGAESNKQYADNIVYLNLISAEEFAATIEAFTYPVEFEECDGTASPTAGVSVGQQTRKQFGLSYRTKKGNDLSGQDWGYKLHLIWGCLAAPSEKAFATVNDSPEAITFSWDVSTTPVSVTGLKPTASMTIDSTRVSPAALTTLEDILYGRAGSNARLPLPDEVIAIFTGATTQAAPVAPTYTSATHTIAIPTTTGVDYKIDGVKKTGNVVLTVGQRVLVVAQPQVGYTFAKNTDVDWQYDY